MSTSIKQILQIGVILVLIDLGAALGADHWTPTTAAGHLWPAAQGGNGHAYQPVGVPEVIPWSSADRAATLAGGYLATITSQAENDFVYAAAAHLFVQAMGNEYGPWLGGYQLPGSVEPAGGWVWVTGEPFEYTAWCPGEPSQTAGPLNEDRIHYLGHGGPAPTWNDQTNAEAFGPMAYVVEYDPVTLEAEDAITIPGGAFRWTVNMGMAEPRALLVHYSNGSSRDASLQVVVNGALVEPNLPCAATGAWDAWGSATTHAYFGTGENTVELRNDANLCIDRITLYGDNTNLAMDKRIASSAPAPLSPASRALDGDPQTSWWVEDPPQWVELDLGGLYPIYRTQVVSSFWQACRFRVEVKAGAGDAYSLVVDRTGNTTPGTAVEPIVDTFKPVSARYVRLTVTGADLGVPEIAEFRVAAATGQVHPIAIGSTGYRTIQQAIDAAGPGDVITLQPGRYSGGGNETIAMKGKRLTLTSIDPNDSGIVARTAIVGTNAGAAVTCTSHEDAGCVLAGLTIRRARAGIYCDGASPTIRNCRIVGNAGAGIELRSHTKPRIHHCIVAGNAGEGIVMDPPLGRSGGADNYPEITNCTIVENLSNGIKGGRPTVTNSILFHNGAEAGNLQIKSFLPTVTYCDVQGGWSGTGNLDADPCFTRNGVWSDSGEPRAAWIDGDYHLQSQVGRWDPQTGTQVVDAVTSPCIDAGDSAMDIGEEPSPNGGRLNLGAHGGTREASMSP